jgi:PIN domain nuclease of toxin-antitoxin system
VGGATLRLLLDAHAWLWVAAEDSPILDYAHSGHVSVLR